MIEEVATHLDVNQTEPRAFLSYTHFDDKALGGAIKTLREALEWAVQARTGMSFRIFQDVEDINPGENWEKKLASAIENADLFVPILTPSFFTSDYCCREAQMFLEGAVRAGRDDLILPIYLIDVPGQSTNAICKAPEVARRLFECQYDDWRDLRFKLTEAETRPRIDKLAATIVRSIMPPEIWGELNFEQRSLREQTREATQGRPSARGAVVNVGFDQLLERLTAVERKVATLEAILVSDKHTSANDIRKQFGDSSEKEGQG